MEYITNDKQLDIIIKNLGLHMSKVDHDFLICELHRHIDFTRRHAFVNGYEQGRLDEKELYL